MIHNKIIAEIHKRFEKITSAHERILFDLGKADQVAWKTVEAADIHCFRVEVKKLRAFLHLVVPEKKPLLPKQLRDYYQSLGAVRDLQLQEQRIRQFAGGKAHRLVAYSTFLKAETATALQQAREDAATLFLPRAESRVLEALPEKLAADTVREFLWKAATKIQGLTQADAPLEDKKLHELRKCLKDLSYNHEFILGETANILPAALAAGNEKIEPFLKVLGRIQDLRSGLELLQPVGNTQEKKMLAAARHQWEKEKESLRHQFKVNYLPIFRRLFAPLHGH